MDGRTEKKRYYLMSKKIYSRRFSTDCFSDFLDDDIFEEGCVYLTPETAPFPFAFDDEPQSEEQNPATVRMTRKDLFEQLYAQTADLPRKDRKASILAAMLPYFDDDSRAESYVNMQFERKLRNLICRRVRLTRKVNLQEFNYFCTSTRHGAKRYVSAMFSGIKFLFLKSL